MIGYTKAPLVIGGLANYITILRLFLLPATVYLLSMQDTLTGGITLLLLVFILDIVDGFVARRSKTVSSFGGFLDVFVDRIVELTIWLFLAAIGQVPLIFPLILIMRIWLVDLVRVSVALNGVDQETGIKVQGWLRYLVASKMSKGGYNFLKLGVFIYLLTCSTQNFLYHEEYLILSILVLFSVTRAFPVIFQNFLGLWRSAIKLQSFRHPPHQYTMLFMLQLIIDTVSLSLILRFI